MTKKLWVAKQLKSFYVRRMKIDDEYLNKDQRDVIMDALKLYIEGED